MSGGHRPRPADEAFVFNIVWTGETFRHLGLFVESQLAQSGARFRFLANACPPAEIAAMERFADAHPGRVVEVVELSRDRMIRHGDCLDEILRTRDDGALFSFIDPDILARGPFLPLFASLLEAHDAVTSGTEVWSEHNVLPEGHPGVNGEYFFDRDGFVFGSPHLAVYRRAPLLETVERWGIGFSSAGNDIPAATREQLDSSGRGYWIYDTAKIVNILFQLDGHPLCHEENPALLHIGGVAHYLAPPSVAPAAQGRPIPWGEGPDWGTFDGMADRYAAASYTAHVLQELTAGRPAPPVPAGVDGSMHARLADARAALVDLVATYRPAPATPSPEPR